MAAKNVKIDGGDYDSAFEDESGRKSTKAKDDIYLKNDPKYGIKRSSRPDYESHWSERAKQMPLLALDAYSRHKELINNYFLYYSGGLKELKRNRSNDKTDMDILRENHQFVWEDSEAANTWEQRLAKKYYEKLFKEYCVADLSRYKENKIGMRWRIEKEVVEGKGQFFCGSKHCTEDIDLRSWEVNFAYVEKGEKKNALIKLRLCPNCSSKLNFHYKRKEVLPKKLSSKQTSGKRIRLETESEETGTTSGPSKPTEAKSNEVETVDAEDDAEIWANKPPAVTPEVCVSKEEEFNEYFDDLFL